MSRFAQITAMALLLGATLLHAGCGNGVSGLTTGGLFSKSSQDGLPANDDPMARPISVAWTSARAQRCGFYFDPVKLRTSYLSYEASQGNAGEQLAKIEKTYDATFKQISANVAADPDYCSDRKGAEIKTALTRHLAGDYTPSLPKQATGSSCISWDCGGGSADQKWDRKKYWDDLSKRTK